MTIRRRVLFVCSDSGPSAVEPLLEICAVRWGLEVCTGAALPRALPPEDLCDVMILELRTGLATDKIVDLLAGSELPVLVLAPLLDPKDSLRLLQLGAEDALDLKQLDAHGLQLSIERILLRRCGRQRVGKHEPKDLPPPREHRADPKSVCRERELRQVQKMEAVGVLAAGIAHDINNILGSIMGLASVLCDDIAVEDHRRQDAQAIAEACKKGRTLVRNLMGFGRKGKFQRRNVFVGEILAQLAESVRTVRDRKLKVDLQLENDLPPVQGDPDQLRQVLRNLVDNALESMHTSGTLRLTACRVELGEEEVSPYRDLRAGSFALLEIIDTGVGMDADTLERAFEPFFTTRPRGEAKGLGLSMAYGAIRHHAGVLRISSEPGKGTRVSVYLPVAAVNPRQEDVDPSRRVTDTKRDPSTLGRGRVVLVVDDEELMRISAKRMLERFGFVVHTAHQGEAAVALLAEDPRRIHLVLLDMIMPVLSGLQAFEKMREVRPDLPILLCSGFARESQTDELLSQGNTRFLLKPFGLDALEKAILSLTAF